MRRLIVIAIAVALIVIGIWPALAGEGGDAATNFRGDGIDYGGHRDGTSPGAAPSHGAGSPRVPEYRVYVPTIGSVNGQPCIGTDSRTFSDQASAAAADAAQEQRWLALIGAGYPLCPGVVAPVGNPAAMALQFWGEVPLPVPAPHIAPGRAITGLPAYLETGGTTGKDFSRDTPLGPIAIGAHGQFFVDWGDGTRDGPFDTVGAAWPDGTITHTYTDTGAYDVVVTERWTATWQLAGRGGPLGGLQTIGRITQFPVTEVQAVRNR